MVDSVSGEGDLECEMLAAAVNAANAATGRR